MTKLMWGPQSLCVKCCGWGHSHSWQVSHHTQAQDTNKNGAGCQRYNPTTNSDGSGRAAISQAEQWFQKPSRPYSKMQVLTTRPKPRAVHHPA